MNRLSASRQPALAAGSSPVAAVKGLPVGESNDAFEREADIVADEVVNGHGLDWSLSRVTGGSLAQRESGGIAGPNVAPPIVHEVLQSPGRPLDLKSLNFFEPRFGHDFSAVRIHTDNKASESARAVNANGYTIGRHIVLQSDKYSAQSLSGKKLLAHELTHCLQQSQADIPAGSAHAAPLGIRLQRDSEEDAKDSTIGSWVEEKLGKVSGVVHSGVDWLERAAVNKLRELQRGALNSLRSRIGRLPEKYQPLAAQIVNALDQGADILIDYLNIMISLDGGLVKGIYDLVEGLASLVVKLTDFYIQLEAGNSDYVEAKLKKTAESIMGLPAGLKAWLEKWKSDYQAANADEKKRKIADFAGQAVAFIAGFFVGAGEASAAAKGAETLETAGAISKTGDLAELAKTAEISEMGKASKLENVVKETLGPVEHPPKPLAPAEIEKPVAEPVAAKPKTPIPNPEAAKKPGTDIIPIERGRQIRAERLQEMQKAVAEQEEVEQLAATGTESSAPVETESAGSSDAPRAMARKNRTAGPSSGSPGTTKTGKTGSARLGTNATQSGGSSNFRPRRGSVEREEGINIPPEKPAVDVDKFARGRAVESSHLYSMPEWTVPRQDLPGIDAWKGGREVFRKAGAGKVRNIYGADVLQVKSIGEVAESTSIKNSVRRAIEKLKPNSFEGEGIRIVNPKSRRLDMVFDLGALPEVGPEMRELLTKLTQESAKEGVEVHWFRYSAGRKFPIQIP